MNFIRTSLVCLALSAGLGSTAALAATGSIKLIDSTGLQYFINTDITFSTSSSASGAVSEASYTHAVAATTMNGGTTMSTLNDAFDGYNTLCISPTQTNGPCQTGNVNFLVYDKNGAATTTSLGTISGVNREVVLPDQAMTSGAMTLTVSRRLFVPDNDNFARWLNIITNTGAAPASFSVLTGNNLGSDSNTLITGTDNGTLIPTLSDRWVASFQNYSGTTSSDVRLCHVLQGSHAAVPLATLNFVNGDDNPYWSYNITLAPGATAIVMNFVSGLPSKAAAAAKCQALANPLAAAHALDFMSADDKAKVVNFSVSHQPIRGGALEADWLLVGLIGALLGRIKRKKNKL